jgi:predicted DCC family thiol-disulfide oxidoreductase YuxK
MGRPPVQVAANTQDQHLVLYDGVCGLCSRLLQFLLARDVRRVFKFASLQSETGRMLVERFGGDPDSLTSFYVIAHYRRPTAKLIARSRAALFVATEVGWPWKVTELAGVLPTTWLDVVYNCIARHRYRIFGRREHCLRPRPDDRGRFVD